MDFFNRSDLYKLAQEMLSEDNFFLPIERRSALSEIFKECASFLEKFEKLVGHKNERRTFEDIFESSISILKNESLNELVLAKYRNKINEANEKKKNLSFDDLFSYVISAIIDFQNSFLETFYNLDNPDFKRIRVEELNQKPKTFLSYAFKDKGLSLCLFLYFYSHGGFLYVDWMWNGKINDCSRLKNIICKELYSSKQFLFLRTTASELKIKGNTTIRQWCSWEIGVFYTKNKSEKFLVSLYQSSSSNFFLNTFQILTKVENGIMS